MNFPAPFFKILAVVTVLSLGLPGCRKTPTAGEPQQQSKERAAEEVAAQAAASPAPTAAPEPTPVVINEQAQVVVFCYHNIESGSRSRALTITPEQFDEEMEAIKAAGFTVISMQDFLAWRRGEKNIPAKSAIITIDDGWVSGYTEAWPILKKHDYPFTLFIYVNYVGSGGKSLSWEQLAEMRDAGVDIQSHTYSHSSLKSPGGGVDKRTAALVKKDVEELGREGWLRKEIQGSKEVLEEKLGIAVDALAYPFGVYSDEARAMVKEAGYEAAFTVYGQPLGIHSPFDLLGRYAVEGTKPEIFQAAINMVGGGAVAGSSGPASAPDVAQLAAASMVTQPADGATISDELPEIRANLETMGEVDPKSVQMRISGFGVVAAKYNPETRIVSYKVNQKLRPRNYTVILSATAKGKKLETRWSFTFDRDAKPAAEPELPARPETT